MERERQEDEMSDVLSRHGDAPSQPSIAAIGLVVGLRPIVGDAQEAAEE